MDSKCNYCNECVSNVGRHLKYCKRKQETEIPFERFQQHLLSLQRNNVGSNYEDIPMADVSSSSLDITELEQASFSFSNIDVSDISATFRCYSNDVYSSGLLDDQGFGFLNETHAVPSGGIPISAELNNDDRRILRKDESIERKFVDLLLKAIISGSTANSLLQFLKKDLNVTIGFKDYREIQEAYSIPQVIIFSTVKLRSDADYSEWICYGISSPKSHRSCKGLVC
jgi:hypothetical protein